MYDLAGKTALVTGAGGQGGIGRAIALRLAQNGANVAVNDLTKPMAVIAEIEALGQTALGIAADVSKAENVKRMADAVTAHFGRLDILVNNAGAPAGRDRAPVVELEEDAFDLIQAVNVKGTFLCCRQAARVMIAQGRGGKIINISSTAGQRGMARFAAYCASKFAVRGFTQALAQELGPHRINVNAICPGLIETERVSDIAAALAPANIAADAYRRQMVAEAVKGTALGRIGQPADIAKMAAFLASSESDFITGASFTVAGGAVMD